MGLEGLGHPDRARWRVSEGPRAEQCQPGHSLCILLSESSRSHFPNPGSWALVSTIVPLPWT